MFDINIEVTRLGQFSHHHCSLRTLSAEKFKSNIEELGNILNEINLGLVTKTLKIYIRLLLPVSYCSFQE